MRRKLISDKRANSHFNNIDSLLKCKRSQGVFGMSFSVIFSIIIIIFFLFAAFMAIRFFMGIQRQAQIGLFIKDFQEEIDKAWNADSSSYFFHSTLPSGIDYACFINMSAGISADTGSVEKHIYKDSRFGSYEKNLVLYPLEKAGDLSHSTLKHIKLPDSNPYCIEIADGKISIKIDKTFEEALPRAS